MATVRIDYMDGRTEILYGEPEARDGFLVVTERDGGGGVKKISSVPLGNVRKWEAH